mmetsp:Transcript_17335/g.26829  ORF Transcript_17335/g.26829 Transcript_17335/m.26829 type:complete len:139 (-) Transcript_17335:1315-1731(-)
MDKDSWGGGIECSILATHYSTEICCIEVKSLQVYKFGEDKGYSKRIMLMYDGIHYDLLAEAAGGNSDESLFVTAFERDDHQALELGVGVVRELQKQGQFTDTSSFSLRCMVCGTGLTGAEAAQAHAKQTGHSNFAENK